MKTLHLKAWILSFQLILNCVAAKAINENEKWARGFNAPGTNNIVTALTADQNYIYAAGLFSRITGGNKSYKLAKYNGVEWMTFTDSINGPDYPMEIKVRNGEVWVADTKGLLRYNGTWQLIGNTNNLPIYDFDFDASGNIYVVGSFTSINGIPLSGVAKYNGANWSAMGSGIAVGPLNQARAVHCFGGEVYIAGPFTNVGGVASNGFAKWNGSSWSSLNTGGMILGLSTHFAEFNNSLYLSALASPTGLNGSNKVFKYTGSTLIQLGNNFDSDIYHLRFVNNRLYVTGNFNFCGSLPINHLAYWNGSSWVDDGQGLNFTTFDIAGTPNCTVVGGVSSPVGISFNFQNIAVRRLNRWMPTGNGMNGSINALLADGKFLYAAGSFTEAGGLIGCVLRWNGLEWDTLSGGLDIRVVRDMVIYKDTLYIGGNFTDPLTLGGRHVAKWNGTAWIEIPGDVNGEVFTLEVHNNELYVGGSFTSMGSGPANQIVKYNGSTWTNLSSLTNNTVKDIKFDQNGIMYVGGGFTTIGGVQARRIAKFDGTTWSEVGSGVDNFVNAIGISPTNEVYIGGQFYLGNNVGILNHVARFNGSVLQSVNGGIGSFSDNVYNFQFLCGKVYATGIFRINGSDTLNHIASNDGTGWQALGNGLIHDTLVNAVGFTMAIQNNRIWVGGNFSFAGNTRSDKIACYGVDGIPVVTLSTLNGGTCNGDTISFVLSNQNTGINLQYHWYVNNVLINNTDSVLALPGINDGDSISAVLVYSPSCGTTDSIPSAPYIVQLTSLAAPIVIQSGNLYTVTNPDPIANYEWQTWDGSIWVNVMPYATGLSFQGTSPGQYRVVASKGTCRRISSAFTITSLPEISTASVPVCNPNPAYSTVMLSQIEGYDQLTVFDLSGRIVGQFQLSGEKNRLLSVEYLPSGLYMFQFIGENKLPAIIRLIRN